MSKIIDGTAVTDIPAPDVKSYTIPGRSELTVDTAPYFVTITEYLRPTTTSSPPVAATSSVATQTPVPHHGPSNSKLIALMVVLLVLSAILSSIIVVWFINWRRKKRSRTDDDRSNLQESSSFEKQMQKNLVRTRKRRQHKAPQSSQSSVDLTQRQVPGRQRGLRRSQRPGSPSTPSNPFRGPTFDLFRRTTTFSGHSNRSSMANQDHREFYDTPWDPPHLHDSNQSAVTQVEGVYIPPWKRKERMLESLMSEAYEPMIVSPGSLERTSLQSMERSRSSWNGSDEAFHVSSCPMHGTGSRLSDYPSPLMRPFSPPEIDSVSLVSGLSLNLNPHATAHKIPKDEDDVSEISSVDHYLGSHVDPYQTLW